METTRISTKGQIILPKALRDAHRWSPGTKFSIEPLAGGVLLRPLRPFPASRLADVAGVLRYTGRPKSIAAMKSAIGKRAKERRDRGRY
jgi:AbrB family looped-hinge helix DNA binding protein